jgi:hypothetical protein
LARARAWARARARPRAKGLILSNIRILAGLISQRENDTIQQTKKGTAIYAGF